MLGNAAKNIVQAVPVSFTLSQNSTVGISSIDYTSLLLASHEYSIGSGKNEVTYTIAHSTAGYVSLTVSEEGAQASWLADGFCIRAAYVDQNGNHSFEIERSGKVSRLPYEALAPKNIIAALLSKGIEFTLILRNILRKRNY